MDCQDKGPPLPPPPSSSSSSKVAAARSFQMQSVVVLATLLVFAVPLFLWSIDTLAERSHLTPSAAAWQPREYLPHDRQLDIQAETTTISSSSYRADTGGSNLNSNVSTSSVPENVCRESRPPSRSWSWISAQPYRNYSTTLLSRWLAPRGEPCRDGRTADITIPGLDSHDDGAATPFELSAGKIHEFSIHALDEAGNRRCLGGDYFETDLSGDSWKSRPPVDDRGDGSYGLSLQVHPDFAGEYNLTVVLLFRGFEGLKFSPKGFALKKELRRIHIRFFNRTTTRNSSNKTAGYSASTTPLSLPLCGADDFSRDAWSGRWTRHARNDSCAISDDGRYRCLDSHHPCTTPWCEGSLGSLESNGWVYSAHCAFRLFTQHSAWECLRGKWIYFWGDSNHVDSIRNLLNFVLGQSPQIPTLPRRFDRTFYNPRNASDSVRITNVFNGHWNDSLNYLGLDSLQNDGFRSLLWRHFTEETTPDVMILNSGLHDGIHWISIRAFVHGAERAADFWADVFKHWRNTGKRLPRLFYRTTVATGGHARTMAFNPNKMEAFNGVMVDKMRERGLLESRGGGGVIDGFDISFPWHWDNRCNDGVHYGRAPLKAMWRDGQIGHHYFVDLMLVHVLLNAICPSATGQ